MAELQNVIINTPWASNGGTVVSPDNAKIGSGWGLETVPYQWLNWFFNKTDVNIGYLLQKGIPEWKVGQEYIADKSYVQYTDTNGTYNVYRCKETHTASSADSPAIGGSKWGLAFSKATPVTEAISNLNLTAIPVGMRFLPSVNKTGADTYSGESVVISDVMKTALGYTTAEQFRNGMSIQASHNNLIAISAAGAASANRLFYYTSATTGAFTIITSAARDLLSQANVADMRTNLGLGDIATQNKNAVSITGGSIAGITDLAIADGGTGASTAAQARINLGLRDAATHKITESPTDTLSALNPDFNVRSERQVLVQGDYGILADIEKAPKNNGIFIAPEALGNGVRVIYFDTKAVLRDIHGLDLPYDASVADSESVGFIVEKVGVFGVSYIQAFDIYSGNENNGRLYIKLYNPVTESFTSWLKSFNNANTLDIGKTATTARTALGLANSATITSSVANVPDTLVRRTNDNKVNADVVGSLTGVASSATLLTDNRTINGTVFNNSGNITTAKWGNVRTFTFSGDVTGTFATDGAANTSTTFTLANTGVVAGSYGASNKTLSATVDAKGRITTISAVDISLPMAQLTGVLPVAKGGTGVTTSVGSGSVVLGTNPKLVSPKGAIISLSSGAITLDTGSMFKYTVTSSGVTFTITGSVSTDTTGSFILELTNGGSGLVTWPSNVKWANGSPPILTTSGTDSLGFYYNGVNWVGYLIGKDIK